MDYKARFYSPYLNHFIQPDSIVPDPSNPQAFNRFAYVGNRPVNFNDPTGHAYCDFIDSQNKQDCEGGLVRSQSSKSNGGKGNGRNVRQDNPIIQPIAPQTPSIPTPTGTPTPTITANSNITVTPTPEICSTPMPGWRPCANYASTPVYSSPSTVVVNLSPVANPTSVANPFLEALEECSYDGQCLLDPILRQLEKAIEDTARRGGLRPGGPSEFYDFMPSYDHGSGGSGKRYKIIFSQ